MESIPGGDNITVQPDKRKIKQRFARAAATYDRQAEVQQRVADRLLHLLARHMETPPQQVLEIGCSTGMLTGQLPVLLPELQTLFINDLVPECKTLVRKKVGAGTNLVFLEGDIEKMALPAGLDLVVSSSTFHWLTDLPALLDRLYEAMAPRGLLCFSLYGPSNLMELREITGIGLDYSTLADLQKLVERNFALLAAEEDTLTMRFPDPLAMLQHLRQTGVNALGSKPWTRSRLHDFSQEYSNRFGSKGGVPLTYHPLYCLARKK
jgi:malonyl-CoA O-methyltransferase